MAAIKEFLTAAKKDGYSIEEIMAFLRKKPEYEASLAAGFPEEVIWQKLGVVPPPPPPVVDVGAAGRPLDLIGEGLIGGLGATLGLPGTLLELGRGSGWPVVSEISNLLPALPTMEQIEGFTDSLGLTGNDYLTPMNQSERFLSAGATGGGASLPFGINPANLLLGVAAGVGAEAAHQLAPDSWWAPLAGGAAAGFGLGAAGAKLKALAAARAAKRELGAARQSLDELLAAHPSVPPKASLEDQLAELGMVHDDVLASRDEAFEEIAGAHGTAQTAQEAGEALQRIAKVRLDDAVGELAAGSGDKALISRLKKIVSAKPESVVHSLLSGGKQGGTDLQFLRATMPEALDEVASFAIRKRKWAGLSPEAQAALAPRHAPALAELSSVSRVAGKVRGEKAKAMKENFAANVSANASARAEELTKAQTRLAAASETHARFVPKGKPVGERVRNAMLSSAAAGSLGAGASALLGNIGTPLVQHGLTAAGAILAAPKIAETLLRVARNPRSAAPTLRGALAGNALMPTERRL